MSPCFASVSAFSVAAVRIIQKCASVAKHQANRLVSGKFENQKELRLAQLDAQHHYFSNAPVEDVLLRKIKDAQIAQTGWRRLLERQYDQFGEVELSERRFGALPDLGKIKEHQERLANHIQKEADVMREAEDAARQRWRDSADLSGPVREPEPILCDIPARRAFVRVSHIRTTHRTWFNRHERWKRCIFQHLFANEPDAACLERRYATAGPATELYEGVAYLGVAGRA